MDATHIYCPACRAIRPVEFQRLLDNEPALGTAARCARCGWLALTMIGEAKVYCDVCDEIRLEDLRAILKSPPPGREAPFRQPAPEYVQFARPPKPQKRLIDLGGTLARLGYIETSNVPTAPGQFRRTTSAWSIFPRDGKGHIGLEIRGERIARVTLEPR